ncbi:RHS repeat domain-containing protein [Gimesia fumaroli]|uniref:tRNA(Glu)-specific nuclease WapA n=1 Tax=Gimesia fumaroli TaxID=2527976 RepID=A0A518IGH6_9PLAN|nr:RHS repeat-associated core domain-containing protein [Gimesia fumaroli]QDV52186.1 tRNA(Glu)-specific nuclease WapA precursor [Gimesia fumaroli]
MNEQSERTTFSYDAVGRATRKQLANGTRTSMAYDAAGRETQITHFTSSNTPFSSFADTYNAAGNRIQRVNLDGDVTTWTYDSSSQVLSERYTDSLGTTITTFAYDAVGNRLVENNDSTITTSVYDAANRLETSEETAGITTYTYDKNGNQTSIEDPVSDITTYSWTYENQLAEIESPNGDLVTYTYAPVNKKSDELRLSKETDLEFTSYMWDDQNIILEQDEVSTVDAEYTVMPQAYGNLISQTRDADSSFYHFDPLGSTRELTDASETVTDSYLYSVFGEVKSSTGTTVNPYQWAGKEGYYRDSESGLYSLRNRFYDSNQGRFKSEDPIGFDAGDNNLYRYVGNNAATDTDPSGLQGHIKRPSKWRTELDYTNRYLELICECQGTRIVGRKHSIIRSRIKTKKLPGWTIAEACNDSCSKRRRGWSGKYTIVKGSIGPNNGYLPRVWDVDGYRYVLSPDQCRQLEEVNSYGFWERFGSFFIPVFIPKKESLEERIRIAAKDEEYAKTFDRCGGEIDIITHDAIHIGRRRQLMTLDACDLATTTETVTGAIGSTFKVATSTGRRLVCKTVQQSCSTPLQRTTRALGTTGGHKEAALVLRGGPGRAFAGHGKYLKCPDTTVPKGTSITLPRKDINIQDLTGLYMEGENWEKLLYAAKSHDDLEVRDLIMNNIEGMATYLEGAKIPDYTLFAPGHPAGPPLCILKNSTTVYNPTKLSKLLEPSMGNCIWAACTKEY